MILSNLSVSCLDAEWHHETGHWYIVYCDRFTECAAFDTAEELMEWLNERGLKLKNSLPAKRGTYKVVGIDGNYTMDEATGIATINWTLFFTPVGADEPSYAFTLLEKFSDFEPGDTQAYNLACSLVGIPRNGHWNVEMGDGSPCNS